MSGKEKISKVSEIGSARGKRDTEKAVAEMIPKNVKFRGVVLQLIFDEVNEAGDPVATLPSEPKMYLKGSLKEPMKSYIEDSVQKSLEGSGLIEVK